MIMQPIRKVSKALIPLVVVVVLVELAIFVPRGEVQPNVSLIHSSATDAGCTKSSKEDIGTGNQCRENVFASFIPAKLRALFFTLVPSSPKSDMQQPIASAQRPGKCGEMTKEFLDKIAVKNTLLVTSMDILTWSLFGPSFVSNLRSAGITYWLVAAMDDQVAERMAEYGITQCVKVNAASLGLRIGDQVRGMSGE